VLKRNDILNGTGRVKKTQKVSTPEWGGEKAHVYVRMLPADELPLLQRYQKRAGDGKESEASVMAWTMILGVSDAKGVRLFRDNDHAKLMKEPLATLVRCCGAFNDLNGFTDEASEKRTKN